MRDRQASVTTSTATTSAGLPVYVVHSPPRPSRVWERQPGTRRYTTEVDLGDRVVKIAGEFKRGDQYDRARFEMTLGSWDGETLYPGIGRPTRMTFARGMGTICPDVYVLDLGLTFALDKSRRFRPMDSA